MIYPSGFASVPGTVVLAAFSATPLPAPADAGVLLVVDAGSGSCSVSSGTLSLSAAADAGSTPVILASAGTLTVSGGTTPPAMTGGVITPGTYVLVSDVYYLPADVDASACSSFAPESETFVVDQGCYQQIRN